MQPPSLDTLNELREDGFRPQVVGCFLHNEKLLFVYNKEFDLWQFPQGGIDNNEDVFDALAREMREELGPAFWKQVSDNDIKLMFKDEILFAPDKRGKRDLQTDKGDSVMMKGKTYFVALVMIEKEQIDLDSSEFDATEWASFDRSKKIVESVEQKGKRRLMRRIVDELHERTLL